MSSKSEGTTVKSGPRQSPSNRRSVKIIQGQEKKIGEDEFMAAAIGDVEWLRQSIRSNRGNINYDKNGLTPLHLAAIHGRVDCLRLIIEKFKVDINLPSKTGWRASHLVISNQTGKRAFQCLCYLLERGADPSLTNDDGISPMHQAASEGHVQCLKALIDVGASVTGVDYRGHTPLDLAKLWGHRKCARILASEQWHQDKSYLAKEMNQLEKLKMEQVLREIEADQENKAHQEFYGDLAFQDWLQTHGLEPKPTGPQYIQSNSSTPPNQQAESPSHPVSKTQPASTSVVKTKVPGESLHTANSIQRPKATSIGAGKEPQSKASTESSPKYTQEPQPQVAKQTTSREHKQQLPEQNKSHETKKDAERKVVIQENVDAENQEPTNEAQEVLHPHMWNKSTYIPKKEYVPILEEHYPKDEYSMLPKYPPKRFARTPTADDEDSRHSPNDNNKDNKNNERPVVYKCKHIGDIHKKKHYDVEGLPKSEIGMHLVNDPTSDIFNRGLLARTLTGRKSSGREMNLPAIMQYMERMSSRTYFPKLTGGMA